MIWVAYGIVRVAMGILGYGGNEWFRGAGRATRARRRRRASRPAQGAKPGRVRSLATTRSLHPNAPSLHLASLPLPAPPKRDRESDWRVIRTLLPYLWAYKVRVIAAVAALVAAKVANVGVPLLLKEIVDSLDQATAMLAVPLALLVAYGALRLSTTLFTELREFLFAKVTQRAVRTIALEVFRHLHALSLRFHLARQTGGLTRDVERGTRGISTLISYTLFSILPTLVEITLVSAILHRALRLDVHRHHRRRARRSTSSVTVLITEWRTGFRRQMNELDSQGQHARDRQPAQLRDGQVLRQRGVRGAALRREHAALGERGGAAARRRCRCSTSTQSAIIACAVTLIMWRATVGVVSTAR